MHKWLILQVRYNQCKKRITHWWSVAVFVYSIDDCVHRFSWAMVYVFFIWHWRMFLCLYSHSSWMLYTIFWFRHSVIQRVLSFRGLVLFHLSQIYWNCVSLRLVIGLSFLMLIFCFFLILFYLVLRGRRDQPLSLSYVQGSPPRGRYKDRTLLCLGLVIHMTKELFCSGFPTWCLVL